MYNLCHFAGHQQWCGQFFLDNGARLNHAGGQVLTDFGAHDCSAFCSAFVQRTFQEARDWGCLTPSPLCLDDPRGFGGNGRQWRKCSARENWLRAAKTCRQDFRISFQKHLSTIGIHYNAPSNHSIGKELIIWEKWWNWCQILWEQASHWQGSTTEPHSSLSPPCLLLLFYLFNLLNPDLWDIWLSQLFRELDVAQWL